MEGGVRAQLLYKHLVGVNKAAQVEEIGLHVAVESCSC